ncbi:MAG TPA: NAD(P)/FAD-dependent oxidoreductase [Spirochaeta sp.]|nr:NAD(P)/FAD-dependent oxidoreductase [Spirochaeta sp.]
MMKKYDAVIIGAGLGGLTAAYELCRSGKKTLLLEQHNLPGGFATSFIRGRFEFEPSLHELPGMRGADEAPGVIRYLLEDAELDLRLVTLPEAYRIILTERGVDARMSFGIDKFIDIIDTLVPGSRDSVSKYMKLCREIQDAFGYLSEKQDKINYLTVLRKYGDFVRTGSYTAEEVADALAVPQKARELIYPYWCYLGVPMDRLSFSIWGTMLNSYLSKEAVIPSMRSHEIASAFIDKIEKLGGDIWFNAKVEKINVADGKINSVVLADGEVIAASHVVSNASPSRVFSTLVQPESEIPPAACRNVNARREGFSLAVVYLGLNKSREELGLTDYSYFIAPHMDTRKLYDASYDIEATELMQAAVCLNSAIPNCSPPGTCILTMTIGQQTSAWEDVGPENYFQKKQILADTLIAQFEAAVGCSLREHIEEFEVLLRRPLPDTPEPETGLSTVMNPNPGIQSFRGLCR